MPTIVQASVVNSAFPLILSGEAALLEAETILGNGSRGAGTDLKQYTIMCQVASSMKWAPWLNANLGDNTGLQYPMGIYLGDTIPAASIIAGDVTGCLILVGGALCAVDANLLVFDKGNSGGGTAPALSNIITIPTGIAIIAERWMNILGIYPQGTLAGDQAEN
jgi:hypothetical protein